MVKCVTQAADAADALSLSLSLCLFLVPFSFKKNVITPHASKYYRSIVYEALAVS
jgi:hypothetical protein